MSNYRNLVAVEDKSFDTQTIDWDATPIFGGTYNGSIFKKVRGEARVFQTFTADDGEKFEAWGTAILNSRLEKIVPGTWVQVEYLGKNAQTKRGVMAHNFSVLYDPSSVPAV